MVAKAIKLQHLRVRVAKSEHNAHIAGQTALNGFARFHDGADAIAFMESDCMADVNAHVYEQIGSNQTAVDWSLRDRFNGNLQVADRVG